MIHEIVGRKIAILGYSREGRSTHQFLLRHYPKHEVGVFDKASVTLLDGAPATTRIFTGDNYLATLNEYDTVVHTPGIVMNNSPVAAALRKGQHITSATNLFFSTCPGIIVGVTGTKGKSTTSALIAALLKTRRPDVRLAGNIGAPMIDALDGATEKTIFVIELSSFQLEDARRSPHVAVLLNIVPEHLDHHGNFAAYAGAKANIAKHQSASDTLVFNPDFKILAGLTAPMPGKRSYFGNSENNNARAFLKDGVIYARFDSTPAPICALNELALRGEGNVQNILAAITATFAFSIPAGEMKKALCAFVPLEHRLEEAGTFRSIRFINDSLSTVPQALTNALGAYPEKEIATVIAGGFDRGSDYAPVGSALAASTVKNIILFPDTGEKIWQALQQAAPQTAIKRFDAHTMEEAVKIGYEVTPADSICLLSPASSSFNLFRDYRDRGEQFKEWVKRLA